MELLKLAEVTYRDTVYQHLYKQYCSETHQYTCLLAVPESVLGSLFPLSQQSC